MDAINEKREQQPKPETIRLEQIFQLIRPERLTPTVTVWRGFSRPVSLEVFPENKPIPFDIYLNNIIQNNISPILPDWITPLNPGDGYQITNEDFNPKSRYAKLRKVGSQPPKIEDGFYLTLSSKGELPKDENVLKELQRLRVHLFFPNWGGSYESQPAGDVSERRTLEFSHFYPLDTGPLPQLSNKEMVLGSLRPYKGHMIGLPKDMNKLSQIEAAFVLDPRTE